MSEPPATIVNLTPHPVTVFLDGNQQLTYPPSRSVDGRSPREAEDVGDLEWLPTADGDLPRRDVRPLGRLVNAPPPRPGTVYIVSRIGALAAHRRKDLLFPGAEVRDDNGAIRGVQYLARLDRPLPRWRRAQARILSWWRKPENPSPVLIGVVFTMATALAGATLGVLADWVNATPVRLWLVVLYFGLFILSLLLGVWLWWRRERARRAFGTAYLIEELGSGWTAANTREFRERVRKQYSAVLEVPGPFAFDDWKWPLDAGAAAWEARLGDLVKAFLAVRHNDDEETANGLFVNAHYPVALGLGARLATARLGMTLGVCQRPSYGRSGPIQPEDAARRGSRRLREPHSFEPADPYVALETAYPGATIGKYRWQLHLALNTHASTAATRSGANESTPLILLLRITAQAWGVQRYTDPLPDESDPPMARVTDWAGVLPPDTVAEVLELRLHHPERLASAGRMEIPWVAYPALARAAADWIIDQTTKCPGRLLLLGACMPQEIGVGIGIGGPGRRSQQWPQNLWPMIWPTGGDPALRDQFIIPNLNLGRGLARR